MLQWRGRAARSQSGRFLHNVTIALAAQMLTHCMPPPPKCISSPKNGCAALHCLSSRQAHFLCEFFIQFIRVRLWLSGRVCHRILKCGTTFMSVKSLQFVGTDVNVDLEVHVDVNVEEHYLAQRCLSCKFFSIQLPAGSPAMPCTL